MCMIIYYHYTDREGLRGILQTRRIRMSPSGRYGEGVYLTRLAPTHGRAKIAQNNWDGSAVSIESSGRVDYTISVMLPNHKVTKHGEIYVFSEDVNIDMTTYHLYSKEGDHDELDNGQKHNPIRLRRRKKDCKIM